MAKIVCPNGHLYDPDIYGDHCPLCPASVSDAPSVVNTEYVPFDDDDPNTGVMRYNMKPASVDKVEEVAVKPNIPAPQFVSDDDRTMVVRSNESEGADAGRKKLVGFLATFTHDSDGQAFNLYEGRNFIGRKQSLSDICIPCDGQISGRHMSITYRAVDGRFFFRDEQSANGTYLNGELLDDGELNGGDILRAGVTEFVFIPIPNVKTVGAATTEE